MSDLTLQQENALATFKNNLHLPNNGFHTLIIDLSKEFHLPFQKVRTVLLKSQRSIEKKIRNEFEAVSHRELTKEHWLELIHAALHDLAQHNTSVMELLAKDTHYQSAKAAMLMPISTEDEREVILENVFCAYEKIVFKPLAAMLHTSPLYWKLMRAEELLQMTLTHREHFTDYPQYMEAAACLFELDSTVRSIELSQ
ncbi:hypothetical protein [Vibrio genomosp. F10]|uniref:hypothetical protein n=1 Tax=Vibrio genomosp. F10 TaxID=723171 RepID=UPI0002E5604F|nr:hypothetical protein [Vibrio genomosp. F10]OEF10658.1 hypothetical protein A1QI_00730 [Vibrio genomosp. F10 str. 9ZB36]